MTSARNPCATAIWQQPLSSELAERIVNLLCGASLDLAVSYSQSARAVACVRSAAQRELLSEYERLEGVRQDSVVESVDALRAATADSELPLKIVGLSKQPEADAATARAALAGADVHIIAAEMHVEFVTAGVNKARALERLCESLGVPLSAVVAFGDGNNDAEMLGAVGLGVAMANARPLAKAAAAETLAWTNAEDGVARRVEELLRRGACGAMRRHKK